MANRTTGAQRHNARQDKIFARAIEAKLDRACSVACSGIPIDLFNGIPALAKKARELYHREGGIDDAVLAVELRAFCESIRAG